MARSLLAVACLGLAMAACGSSAGSSPRVALVAGQIITKADVDRYQRYAASFYKLALDNGSLAGNVVDCAQTKSACVVDRANVLRRLLEEKVVLSYAHAHRIQLTGLERQQVNDEIQSLRSSDPTAAQLLSAKSVTAPFLRQVLQTEVLVRKVEAAIVGSHALSGRSFHLALYSIPVLGPKTRDQAIEFATFGRPIPVGTSLRREWIAAFRLKRDMRRAARAALVGDEIGPFQRPGLFVVARVLGKGRHVYGRPAREAREIHLFRLWLDTRLARSHPICYDAGGHRTACPSG